MRIAGFWQRDLRLGLGFRPVELGHIYVVVVTPKAEVGVY